MLRNKNKMQCNANQHTRNKSQLIKISFEFASLFVPKINQGFPKSENAFWRAFKKFKDPFHLCLRLDDQIDC